MMSRQGDRRGEMAQRKNNNFYSFRLYLYMDTWKSTFFLSYLVCALLNPASLFIIFW